jgi:hypothetical protein
MLPQRAEVCNIHWRRVATSLLSQNTCAIILPRAPLSARRHDAGTMGRPRTLKARPENDKARSMAHGASKWSCYRPALRTAPVQLKEHPIGRIARSDTHTARYLATGSDLCAVNFLSAHHVLNAVRPQKKMKTRERVGLPAACNRHRALSCIRQVQFGATAGVAVCMQ